MPHWRHLMTSEYLHAADLMDREVVVTIEKVTKGEFPDFEDPKQKTNKPVLWFVGKKKPLGINSTIARSIAKLYGSNNVDDWVGKSITIYPTTTRAFGEEWECIRVKNRIPQTAAPAGKNAQRFRRPPDEPAAPAPVSTGDQPSQPFTDEDRALIEEQEREMNE